MKQWDILKFPAPDPEHPHYFVVLSPDEFCAAPSEPVVNVLLCYTFRPADRAVRAFEVLLDEADSFSRKTVVNCVAIYRAEKIKARDPLGNVSPTRRRAIARKVIDCFRLQA